MKIGILSMQDVPNFGSVLQSYSLKRIMEGMGHEVSFISIEPNEADNELVKETAKNYLFETGKTKGLKSKIRKIDRYAINRLYIKKKAEKQDQAFAVFRKDCLGIQRNMEKRFDCCVIGSDEVFNCNTASRWGFTTQLFGNVRQADRVITYAASCGATTIDSVSDSVKERIRDAFANISAFSVRDENTKDFVLALTQKEPTICLDPVVIGDFEDEMSSRGLPEGLPSRYCVVYSYYNRINQPERIRQIRSFARRHGMKIISVGAPQMWINRHIVCDPFQALNVFRNAEFVITDTFHGTIFSAKYSKRFAVFIQESNRNKLLDLIDRLEIKDHLISSMEELEGQFNHFNNLSKNQLISEGARRVALDYLKRNI